MKPTRNKFTILKQVVELIPRNLVPKLARKYGNDRQSRSFSPWSHVVSMIYAQLAHSLSLNDVCDSLSQHSSALETLRGATPPSRNGLSHANRSRDPRMAEELFWETMKEFRYRFPNFGSERKRTGLPRRFKKTIHAVDSTTIGLVANCMDWAKHRRRKAAAKCHMRLNLGTYLPEFVRVKEASGHDSTVVKSLCSGLEEGEIVVFDMAYTVFEQLNDLNERGISWVSRAKDNMAFEVVEERAVGRNIKKDLIIRPAVLKSKNDYPDTLRLVVADIEVDGHIREMRFITNNKNWAASSVADLYKCRWGIETFFKEIKQSLQMADFLGYSENAVKWQIWTALLTYVLLRFISFTGKWKGSFARLFTTIRSSLWSRFSLMPLLQLCRCGTASGPPRTCGRPEQLYIPGLKAFLMGQQT